MKKHVSNAISRRRFLFNTTLGMATIQILPSGIVSGAERVSANDKINIAGIGVGAQGGGDIDAMAGEGQNIVALCDVDDNYAAKTFGRYPKAKRFKDYRVMLDQMDKEIDAVVIGTPDHTHAVIAMEAMKRGKHVYCEKPLTQAALLGAIAIRFPGQTLQWDDQAMRFTNNDAANAFVQPTYCEGWNLTV